MGTMKTNEVRVGNRVLFAEDGTEFIVTDIVGSGLNVKNEEENTWIEADQFEGIPLTEEWLLKFGFKVQHEINRHYAINDPNNVVGSGMISIFPTINDQWHIALSDITNGYKDYILSTKIKYVHQLQNLYFALIGEELTIKE